MAVRVLLSEEGHFEGIEDEEGNTVAFLVECHDKQSGGDYKNPGYHGRRRKHAGEDVEGEAEDDEADDDDEDADRWYPDEEAPVEMFATEIACDNCGVGEPTLQCSKCNDMLYCSEKCADEDWTSRHQHECQQPVDTELSAQLIEALTTNEIEGIAAHPVEENDDANEICIVKYVGESPRAGRGGSGRGGSTPRRATAPARPGRRATWGRPGGRSLPLRRNPFSPLRRSRTRQFASPPAGAGRSFRRWRDTFGRRRWYSPRLYPWFTRWYPGYAFDWVTSRLVAPFLYWPRSRVEDPDWYFDPLADPRIIDRQLELLRMRYAHMIARGYDIIPDYNRGRFRWIRRRF